MSTSDGNTNLNVNQEQQSQLPQPPQGGQQRVGAFQFFPVTFLMQGGSGNNNANVSQTTFPTPPSSTQSTTTPTLPHFNFQLGPGGIQVSNTSPETTNPTDGSQLLHFFFLPVSSLDGSTPAIFFTPIFMPPPEPKPRASESAIKKLSIVKITQEHIGVEATCPICLEPFQIAEGGGDGKCEPVREMPCKHMFCESCLFEWLRQNNTCPMCRIEIEPEERQTSTPLPPTQQPNINHTEQGPTVDVSSTQTSSTSRTGSFGGAQRTTDFSSNGQQRSRSIHRHPYHRNSRPRPSSIGCALDRVGCCGESDNTEHSTIITLPQCNHRFHASCLRTSLLVEGYSLDTASPLTFRCPTCRVSTVLQSDFFKLWSNVSPRAFGNGLFPTSNTQTPINFPLIIQVPNSDEMDLGLD